MTDYAAPPNRDEIEARGSCHRVTITTGGHIVVVATSADEAIAKTRRLAREPVSAIATCEPLTHYGWHRATAVRRRPKAAR